MKNKIISAMLLGMSASMVAPSVTAFAAEEVAVETAAEVSEEENEIELSSEDAKTQTEGDIEVMSLEGEDTPGTKPGTDPENTAPSMYEYATNTEAKIADTPDDFEDKITTFSVKPEVFGAYAEPLNAYVAEADKTSLYDCEMSMVKKVEEIAVDESIDVVIAMKYQMALAFEEMFGESSFQAGRDIRRTILVGKDAEFEACVTVAEIDALYKDGGGTTVNPADIMENTGEDVGEDIGDDESQGDGEDKEDEDLSLYVENMNDFSIVLGSEVLVPEVSFDTEKIASVDFNVKQVNPYAIGEYEFLYIITGVDGTEQIVKKICNVVLDPSIESLKEKVIAQLDTIDDGSLIDQTFKDMWIKVKNEAIEKINLLVEKSDMEDVIEEVVNAFNDIKESQQLAIAKDGYVSIIKSYYAELSFKTDAQAQMAEEVMNTTIEDIMAAETVDEAAKILEEGKRQLKELEEEQGDSVDSLKEKSIAELEAICDEINDGSSTLPVEVLNIAVKKLDSCESSKEIDSVMNSSKSVFSYMKKLLVDKDMSVASELLKSMKGLASDSDTTAVIEVIASEGAAIQTVEDGKDKVRDACQALALDVKDFAEYLSDKSGESVSGETKVEVYRAYIKINSDSGSEDLDEVKASAKDDVEYMISSADWATSDEVKQKLEAIKADAFSRIDAAKTKEDVDAVIDSVEEKIAALEEEFNNSVSLSEAKDAAISDIQEFVDGQADANLKAQLYKIANVAIEAIKNAKTEDQINFILSSFESDANAIVDAYDKENTALADAKANALEKLASLESQANTEYETDKMKQIMSTARKDIDAAKTVEECSEIYAKAKNEYSSAYLEGMRSAYEKKIDDLFTAAQLTSESCISQAKTIIERQKANLQQATNEKTMQNCLSLAEKQLNQIVELQKNEAAIADAKAAAIKKLQEMYPNPSANGAKILESYYNKINAATSTNDIDTLLAQAQSAMTNAGETTTGSGEVSKLVQARADAISALTNMLSSVPASSQEAAKQVLEEYVRKINAATTESEIAQLLEEGKTALTKYGGDPNTAIPNNNTATNTGSGTGNAATAKGSDVAPAENVKTGDENMGVIALAAASIAGAFGAAVLSVRRFLKR